MPPVQHEKELDMVITAKPSNPPISAFVLFNLLRKRGIKLSSAIHVHSSLREKIPDNLQHCIGAKDHLIQPHDGLTMTVIWKEGKEKIQMSYFKAFFLRLK